MVMEKEREVQPCLLTHKMRLEMQMANLAVTPGAPGCQAWSPRGENAPKSKCLPL